MSTEQQMRQALADLIETWDAAHRTYPDTATCRSGPGVIAGAAMTEHCDHACRQSGHREQVAVARQRLDAARALLADRSPAPVAPSRPGDEAAAHTAAIEAACAAHAVTANEAVLSLVDRLVATVLDDAATSFIDWGVMHGHEPSTPEIEQDHRTAAWLSDRSRQWDQGTARVPHLRLVP